MIFAQCRVERFLFRLNIESTSCQMIFFRCDSWKHFMTSAKRQQNVIKRQQNVIKRHQNVINASSRTRKVF